jgi:hypothetical protein
MFGKEEFTDLCFWRAPLLLIQKALDSNFCTRITVRTVIDLYKTFQTNAMILQIIYLATGMRMYVENILSILLICE